MGEKTRKCDQFFCPTSDFSDFYNPCFFCLHVASQMMWVLLTKLMQKSVITVCLHFSFAIIAKLTGVLGTNVATRSWLHWSPVPWYNIWCESHFWHHCILPYMYFQFQADDHIRQRKSQCHINQYSWSQSSGNGRHTYLPLPVAAPEILFVGGIEGENAFLRGQKSKNLLKMADFCHFFLQMGLGY